MGKVSAADVPAARHTRGSSAVFESSHGGDRLSSAKPSLEGKETMAKPGLLERLDAGPVICAEGYLFELERRGYLQAGAYVPEVVLDFPEQVENLHRDFLRAGSDVIEAFTNYAHREKLRLVG